MEASDAPVAAPSTSSQPIPRSASVSCHSSRALGGKKQKRTPLYQRSVSGHDWTVCWLDVLTVSIPDTNCMLGVIFKLFVELLEDISF